MNRMKIQVVPNVLQTANYELENLKTPIVLPKPARACIGVINKGETLVNGSRGIKSAKGVDGEEEEDGCDGPLVFVAREANREHSMRKFDGSNTHISQRSRVAVVKPCEGVGARDVGGPPCRWPFPLGFRLTPIRFVPLTPHAPLSHEMSVSRTRTASRQKDEFVGVRQPEGSRLLSYSSPEKGIANVSNDRRPVSFSDALLEWMPWAETGNADVSNVVASLALGVEGETFPTWEVILLLRDRRPMLSRDETWRS